jgi:hypothetical protein
MQKRAIDGGLAKPRRVCRLGSASKLTCGNGGKNTDGSSSSHNNKMDREGHVQRPHW